MAKLTEKQLKFADEYIVDLNATQAAKRAGYSEKTARSIGQRLLTNVDIQAEIAKRQEERAKRLRITQDDVIMDLCKLKDQCMAKESVKQTLYGSEIDAKVFNPSAAAKVLELLGKHLGMFRDKVELSGQVNNPFEGLTTQELLKLIGESEDEG